MQLSQAYAQGRDNNFNLIRIIAALSVLVAHSWPLALGPRADPLFDLIGLGLGEIAVDIFFLASGFLVGASLWKRGNLADFLVSRALRIYPALLVVVLAALVLGLAMTSLRWSDYLLHGETWRFFWKNALALFGDSDRLPGVFTANPFPRAVNGSLWTLGAELRMYLLLAVFWLLAGLAKGERRKAWSTVIVVAAAATMFLYLFQLLAPGTLPKALILSKRSFVPAFLAGAACFVLRHHIRLRTHWFLVAVAAVIAAGSWADARVLKAVYLLALPYLVLFLAYVPGGLVRRINDWGDYSYGVYIFAFPVQQTIAALVPGVSIAWMIAGATTITLVLAWCSWHFIESPALEMKERVMQRLRGMRLPWREGRAAAQRKTA